MAHDRTWIVGSCFFYFRYQTSRVAAKLKRPFQLVSSQNFGANGPSWCATNIFPCFTGGLNMFELCLGWHGHGRCTEGCRGNQCKAGRAVPGSSCLVMLNRVAYQRHDYWNLLDSRRITTVLGNIILSREVQKQEVARIIQYYSLLFSVGMGSSETAAILYQPRTRTVTAFCPHKNSWRQWTCKVWGVFCSQWMLVSATLALSSIYLTMEAWRAMYLHSFCLFLLLALSSKTFSRFVFMDPIRPSESIHLSGRWWDDHGLGILQRPPAVERTSTCHWHGTLAARNQGFAPAVFVRTWQVFESAAQLP